MLRSKCNAYSSYRMEEHTKGIHKKKKCFDLKKENKRCSNNAVQGVCSRKENILAILVAGANRRKKQVNCVK